MTVTYTAFDGEVFNNQKDCEKYEDKLKLLNIVYHTLTDIVNNIPDNYKNEIYICNEGTDDNENFWDKHYRVPGDILTVLTNDKINDLKVLVSLLEKYKIDG